LSIQDVRDCFAFDLRFAWHLISLLCETVGFLPLSASGDASVALSSRMAHAIRLDKAERAKPVLRPDPGRRQGAERLKIGGTARSVGVPIFCL
jgi:hypothetical protein